MFHLESTGFGNYSASVSLANGFAAPSLQQQPCHGRRAAHTKRAPTRSEGTKPSDKPGTWQLRCAGTAPIGASPGLNGDDSYALLDFSSSPVLSLRRAKDILHVSRLTRDKMYLSEGDTPALCHQDTY